jgi:glycosyltransferase involved in cell wall biosynthesis
MKLLVIVPMYNSSKFINECLNSILSQGVETRVIVVNDASTDRSEDQAKRHSQIELINNPVNVGTYRSINRALALAESDSSWTHYLIHGADDVSYLNRFKLQLEPFRDPQKIAVGCRFERVNHLTGAAKVNNAWVNESVLIFSRRVFETVGYYDSNRVGCDTEYKARLLLAFPEGIAQVNEVLIKSYLHENNLTKRIPIGGSVRREYVRDFTERHRQMMVENSFYKGFQP